MFDAIGSFFNTIMQPLYYAVSAVLKAWHWLFVQVGMDPESGWSWVFAIIGLTVTIRALLIPLFVKQIKSSRNMQLLQPKVKELQKKYGHDRERLAQEQMKLYKDTGTNPLASCLPLLLQMPVFLALFRVISKASSGHALGVLSNDDARHIQDATIFGAQIASRFIDGAGDGGSVEVKIITAFLVVAMCATTFMTQHQLMRKNMPADALSGPYAQQQKMLLYVLPFVFAIGGVAFPMGVLFYWTTSNLWTMGQQFYVIRNNPAPGTEAMKAKEERDAAKGKGKVKAEVAETTTEVAEDPNIKKRQQPKKKSRRERRDGGAKK